MTGGGYSFSHFTPSSFNAKPDDSTPRGNIDVQSLNTFALYGLSNKLNLLVIIPIEHWRQTVNVDNVHVNDAELSGIGDVTFGFRWLIMNQTESTGHRIYAGVNVSIPTAESYKVKLFSAEAQDVPHNHFAIGKGHYASMLTIEWWHRLHYPVLAGVSAGYSFPLNRSDRGFKSGNMVFLDVQATILKSPLLNGLPYFMVQFRHQSPDNWDEKDAINTGGKYIDGAAAMIFSLSGSLSLISSLDFPLWREFVGSQLDNFHLSITFQKTLK